MMCDLQYIHLQVKFLNLIKGQVCKILKILIVRFFFFIRSTFSGLFVGLTLWITQNNSRFLTFDSSRNKLNRLWFIREEVNGGRLKVSLMPLLHF